MEAVAVPHGVAGVAEVGRKMIALLPHRLSCLALLLAFLLSACTVTHSAQPSEVGATDPALPIIPSVPPTATAVPAAALATWNRSYNVSAPGVVGGSTCSCMKPTPR